MNLHIQDYDTNHVLCLYDGVLEESNYFKKIKSNLSEHVNATWYSKSHDGEPTYSYLEKIFHDISKQNVSLVISFGGGSTIDIAKGISLLLTNKCNPIKLKGFPKGLADPINHITVPSIVGSGAEISYNAVFIDEKKEQKLGINSLNNFPCKTIYDPDFILTAPQNAIVSSAFDTLVHCVDSFGSIKNTPFSRILSIEGFKKTFGVLYENKLRDIEGVKDLCIGSYCGISALMNSGDGPTNGFAYYFGVKEKVPHGIAGAMFLLEVMKYNYENGYKDYKALDSNDSSTGLFEKMEQIYSLYEIPRLVNFNYSKEKVEEMAEISGQSLKGSFSGNPVPFNSNSAYAVLNKLL